jgi:hypothetical protein
LLTDQAHHFSQSDRVLPPKRGSNGAVANGRPFCWTACLAVRDLRCLTRVRRYSGEAGLQMPDFCASGTHVLEYAPFRFSNPIIFGTA